MQSSHARLRTLTSRLSPVVLLLLAPTIALAQSDSTARVPSRLVRGVVLASGAPVAGVNVFDMETLEGVITTSDGRFTIPVADSARRRAHLTARHIGFKPADTTVTLDADSVVIRLESFTALASVSVLAGRYTATAERTSTLTPLEVVSIPGSNADINSAIKTLPGVQNVDEGTGLFVRGGDFTETRIFVDGAPLFTAYQFEAPTGSVAGTINPFLTDGITFSSGGFGAQWGNALSGVVDLRTQGRPARSFTNVNGSILGLALGGGLALPHRVGVSATVGYTNLSELLHLNGNVRNYEPAPNGRTGSALAAWDYRRGGTLKVFALRQENGLGIPVQDPAFTSTYTSRRASDIAVASWRDSLGSWRPFVSASSSGYWRKESKGVYDQTNSLRSLQLRGTLAYVASDRFTILAGTESERISAAYSGQFPANSYNPAPGAPTTSSHLDAAAVRNAAFLTLDTRPASSVELIVGARSDNSGFTTRATVDPRVSFAWVPRDQLTFTAAWGIYHQVADPAFLDRLETGSVLAPLSSEMAIAGVQVGEGQRQMRVELWTKRYANLVGLTRTYTTVAGLAGRARGADLFARVGGPLGVKYRLTWSAAASRRADPNTGLDAPAPFDVTHSVTAVAERDWGGGWHGGIAYRYATGRPFTDVAGAAFDPMANVYVPRYAAPFAARLPDFRRTDLVASKQRPFGANRFGVAFIGVNNLLNEDNTFSYTWSRDYSQRLPIRSTVSRTFFIGANLVLLAQQ
jgi:vitamin B12 transporter